MAEVYCVERTYECGCVGEKTKFWIEAKRTPKKVGRTAKTSIRKQQNNKLAAIRQLARVLNANFQNGDCMLGLDYAPSGMAKLVALAEKKCPKFSHLSSEEQDSILFAIAEHEAVLCLRRVSGAMKKRGLGLKYVIITSDRDGGTGERKRIHHHLVVNRESVPFFSKKWEKMGSVDWEFFAGQKDFYPVAEYYLRQVRHIPNAKQYICSRNLLRPQPQDRILDGNAELIVPAGGTLLFRQVSTNDHETLFASEYIRYLLPKKGQYIMSEYQ